MVDMKPLEMSRAMQTDKVVAVIGRGTRFDRRFGAALEAAGYGIREMPAGPAEGVCAYVLSRLDGELEAMPLLDDQDKAQRCILISDQPPPDGSRRPAVMLAEKISAEMLLFHLTSICHDAAQRRADERIATSLVVRYRVITDDGGALPEPVESELFNLSLGGAFIRSLRPPPLGSRVQLELEVSADRPPLSLRGRVVHQVVADLEQGMIVHGSGDQRRPLPTHPGFAVAFDGSSFEVRSVLQRLLRERQQAV
jgi:hypothetical protein